MIIRKRASVPAGANNQCNSNQKLFSRFQRHGSPDSFSVPSLCKHVAQVAGKNGGVYKVGLEKVQVSRRRSQPNCSCAMLNALRSATDLHHTSSTTTGAATRRHQHIVSRLRRRQAAVSPVVLKCPHTMSDRAWVWVTLLQVAQTPLNEREHSYRWLTANTQLLPTITRRSTMI
jgi:hypothetical protein